MDSRATKGKRRPNFSVEFKAKLAAQACEPEVSVSKLALEHGINTNMLFRWRREYRSGELCAPGPAAEASALVPVSVVGQSDAPLIELPSETTRFRGSASSKQPESLIEIQVAGAVVRVQGEVDVLRLRAVLTALRA